MVIVDILLATICFTSQASEVLTCHNALIGGDTPRGTYTLQQRLTDDPFYGGDVLQFREDDREVYAIHRVWLGRPKEQRGRRLEMSDPKQRTITKGCINVSPAVYNALVTNHRTDTLIIK